MRTAHEIATELGGARKDGNGWKCRCPCHDDQHGSLHISQADDGGFLAHCFAGCDDRLVWQTIRERLGLNGERLASKPTPPLHTERRAYLPPREPDPADLRLSGQLPSADWRYRSASGLLLLVVARYDRGGRKIIRPWRWDGARWAPGSIDAPRPLYGLPELSRRPDDPVLLVEGEKTAEAARRLFPGHVCMTWPGGADGVRHVDFGPLRGRRVLLLPDADDPGRHAMGDAASRLKTIASTVTLISPPDDVPQGWDVADADWTPDQAARWLRDQRRDILPFVWAVEIDPAGQPAPEIVESLLTRGAMSVVYGESNSGKTYVVLHIGLSLCRGVEFLGLRTVPGAVIYVAAEGAQSIEHRVLAYQIRHQIRELPFGIVKTSLDLCGSPDDAQRLSELVKAKAAEIGLPVALIIFDTLARAIAGGNENSPEDMGAIVKHSDMLRRETGAHVLWVHHTGKDLARGARGHSSLRAATDTEIEVTHDQPSGLRVVKVTKQRDLDSMGMERAGKLVTVELGIRNQWGKAVTACVVEDAGTPVRSPRLSGAIQQSIFGHLQSAGGSMDKRALRDAMDADGAPKSSVYSAIRAMVAGGIIDDGVARYTITS